MCPLITNVTCAHLSLMWRGPSVLAKVCSQPNYWLGHYYILLSLVMEIISRITSGNYTCSCIFVEFYKLLIWHEAFCMSHVVYGALSIIHNMYQPWQTQCSMVHITHDLVSQEKPAQDSWERRAWDEIPDKSDNCQLSIDCHLCPSILGLWHSPMYSWCVRWKPWEHHNTYGLM